MKKSTITTFLVTFLSLALQAQQSSQTEAEINQVYEKLKKAYQNLDPAPIEELYAEDAYYLQPGNRQAIQQGNREIKLSFAEYFSSVRESGGKLSIAFCFQNREVHNTVAYDVGYYKLTLTNKEGVQEKPDVGKFITVLEKQPDGSWKFTVDAFNAAPLEAYTCNE